MLRGITSAAVAFAILATPAIARGSETFPGQVPVTDPISLQAIAVAAGFWRERGLTACPDGVQTFMADSLMDGDDIYALGRGGNCQAWLASGPLHEERTYLDFPTYRDRRFDAADECREWTHEIGHALGLGHTADGGVMDPMRGTVPYHCVTWAKRLYPAPPARHHRHRRAKHGHP